jgi:hypothetical protein
MLWQERLVALLLLMILIYLGRLLGRLLLPLLAGGYQNAAQFLA